MTATRSSGKRPPRRQDIRSSPDQAPTEAPPAPAISESEEATVTEARERHIQTSAASQLPAPPRRATFLRSFVYAWSGLVYAIRTQRNARVHAAIGTVAIVLGIVLRISPVEFAIVFVAITGVFIAEMFNTVAEACVDLATSEYHPLARIAKDVAAGAVLLNAMLSVAIGVFVYVPHLWPLLLRLIGR